MAMNEKDASIFNLDSETAKQEVKEEVEIMRRRQCEKLIDEFKAQRKKRFEEFAKRHRPPRRQTPSEMLLAASRREREAHEKINSTILTDKVLKECFGAFSEKMFDDDSAEGKN